MTDHPEVPTMTIPDRTFLLVAVAATLAVFTLGSCSSDRADPTSNDADVCGPAGATGESERSCADPDATPIPDGSSDTDGDRPDRSIDAADTVADSSDSGVDGWSPPPGDYFIAPNGDDSNPGTKSNPFGSVARGIEAAAPGDRVYVRGGTYKPDERIGIQKDGEQGNRIVLRAYPGENPLLDFAEAPGGNGDDAINFWGASWWHVRGLHLKNAPAGGFSITGDSEHVTLENCEVSYSGRNTEWGANGFQVHGRASDILVENCDAHHNANLKGNKYEHADGFTAGSPEKPGIDSVVFRGCRAWHNADDGIDLFFAQDEVLIERMWAFKNGIDDDEGSISGTPNRELGNGNGFKLGGKDQDRETGPAPHTVRHCVSASNARRGFNENSNGAAMTINQNSSFDNGNKGFRIHEGDPSEMRNNLSFRDPGHKLSAADSAFNTWDDATGVTVDADDFQSLDVSELSRPRGPDGSLPDVDFLHLTGGSDLIDAGTDVGLPYEGTGPDLGAFEHP